MKITLYPGAEALRGMVAVSLVLFLVCAAGTPVPAHETAAGTDDAARKAIPYYDGKLAKDPVPPPLPKVRELKPSEYAGKSADPRKLPDTSEALDEAAAGSTRLGTPIEPRTAECFPAEPRDLFWEMDQLANSEGKLVPIDFDIDRDGRISNLPPQVPRRSAVDSERDAIRGRNTWILWGGGNEVFWNWLQQEGYGTHDFLILLDSRQRDTRFSEAGLINQPGMAANRDPAKKILGLYLDLPAAPSGDGNPNPILMRPPPRPKGEAYESAGKSGNGSAGNGSGYGEGRRYEDAVANNVETHDAQGRMLPEPVDVPGPPSGHKQALFKAGDEALYKYILGKLPQDGVDPQVYGYPSGIVGLRLFPNPDFFGSTEAAGLARRYWKARVEDNHDRYYTDAAVYSDRRLVRPFRVSMSCGFCHVGPHPLNPPLDPNQPRWENLSSAIGNQYWHPQKSIGALLPRNNFIHHFVGSQQPGTIDTSQVASDHINNSNTINAVFDVPARLEWANSLPFENQSDANLGLPSVRFPDGRRSRAVPRVLVDGSDSIGAFGALARVYLNIGTYYEQWERTNNIFIGFRPQRPFSVETCQRNSVYWVTNEKYRAGYLRDFFTMKQQPALPPQPPPASPTQSLPPQNSTAPMKLRTAVHAPGDKADWFGEIEYAGTKVQGHTAMQRITGRKVWLYNCAICHSSKQPPGFSLDFSPDWKNKAVPDADEPAAYTLPTRFEEWEEFRASPAMKDYRRRLMKLVASVPLRLEAGQVVHAGADQVALFLTKPPGDGMADRLLPRGTVMKVISTGDGYAEVDLGGAGNGRGFVSEAMLELDPAVEDHPFWKDNFLSTDMRIPVTLTGTNAGRTLGTNGTGGHMWADFSSDTYKGLPGVGDIRYYNPYSAASVDRYGNNAVFPAPGGGVGYYRPASHISLWATAPFLHNNTLGLFNNDPGVRGRLAAFDDAIRKMLWQKDRAKHSMSGGAAAPPGAVRSGDLRASGHSSARNDTGFIYRIPQVTRLQIGPSFVRPLVEGVAGETATRFLSVWLWVLLGIVGVWIAWRARARHAGFALLAGSIVVGVLLLLSGAGGTGRGAMVIPVLVMAISSVLELSNKGWWFLVAGLALLGWWFLTLRQQAGTRSPWNIFIALAITATLLCVLVMIFGAGTTAGYLVGSVLWLRKAGWYAGIPLAIGAVLLAARVFSRHGGDGVARFIHTALVIGVILVGFVAHQFINGRLVLEGQPKGVDVGPIPVGTPVNFLMNLDPESPEMPKAVVSMFYGITRIKKENLEGERAWKAFSEEAGAALMAASKCPDYVLDRGHWFGEELPAEDKESLIAFLKTL